MQNDLTNFFAIAEMYGPLIPDTLRTLRAGDVFIDIGANSGIWTILAKSLQPKLKAIFCFEPQMEIFGELCDNIKINKFNNVFPFPVAIGTQSGEIGMSTYPGHSGKAHIAPNEQGFLAIDGNLVSSFIQSYAEKAPRVMIKIDVEGYEHNVLKSLEPLLRISAEVVVIVEINSAYLSRFNSSVGQVYSFMDKLGYRAKLGEGDGKQYDEIFFKSLSGKS